METESSLGKKGTCRSLDEKMLITFKSGLSFRQELGGVTRNKGSEQKAMRLGWLTLHRE